jgi:hypothetical protein
MGARQRSARASRPRRRAVQPATTHSPTVVAARPDPATKVRAGLHVAGRRLQVAGLSASKFAYGSMREVTGAAKASRKPMHTLWRTMQLAGRHIARDAMAAWDVVVTARTRVLKLPVVRSRRPAA